MNKRTSEIIKIYQKLKELNLGITGFEEFDYFRKVCNQFIRDGRAVSGKIEIPGTKRIIMYDFSGKKVNCMLKYDNSI